MVSFSDYLTSLSAVSTGTVAILQIFTGFETARSARKRILNYCSLADPRFHAFISFLENPFPEIQASTNLRRSGLQILSFLPTALILTLAMFLIFSKVSNSPVVLFSGPVFVLLTGVFSGAALEDSIVKNIRESRMATRLGNGIIIRYYLFSQLRLYANFVMISIISVPLLTALFKLANYYILGNYRGVASLGTQIFLGMGVLVGIILFMRYHYLGLRDKVEDSIYTFQFANSSSFFEFIVGERGWDNTQIIVGRVSHLGRDLVISRTDGYVGVYPWKSVKRVAALGSR